MDQRQIVDPRHRIAQLLAHPGVGKTPRLQRQHGPDQAQVVLDAMVHFPDEKLLLVQRRLHGLQRTPELDGACDGVAQSGQEIDVIGRERARGGMVHFEDPEVSAVRPQRDIEAGDAAVILENGGVAI